MIQPVSRSDKAKIFVKTVAATTATAAVATGTALYLAKTGKLDKFAKTENAQKAVENLKTVADQIVAKAKPIINKAGEVLEPIKNKVAEFKETVLAKYFPQFSKDTLETFNNFKR